MTRTPVDKHVKRLTTKSSDFIEGDAVGPSRRDWVQFPAKHLSSNDDAFLEPYRPSQITYAGKQRRAIHENFETCSSAREHIERATREDFPSEADIPLKEDTREAAYFARDTGPVVLQEFRLLQLKRAEQLVNDTQLAQAIWDAAIPEGIAPAAGKLKTAAVGNLMRQYGIKGQRWIRRFATGFPIAGTLSQDVAFPPEGKYNDLLPRAELSASGPRCLRERAAKSGHSHAKQLWEEAKEQGGWMACPTCPARPDRKPICLGGYALQYRFPLWRPTG